jgi:hypothetical protein
MFPVALLNSFFWLLASYNKEDLRVKDGGETELKLKIIEEAPCYAGTV